MAGREPASRSHPASEKLNSGGTRGFRRLGVKKSTPRDSSNHSVFCALAYNSRHGLIHVAPWRGLLGSLLLGLPGFAFSSVLIPHT
jgi:hypothetical protein